MYFALLRTEALLLETREIKDNFPYVAHTRTEES